MILAMTLVLFACKRADVKAATDNGVSLNVPSKMDIIFNEDGTATVDDMYLENASLVPVELQNINIKEFNDWEIVPKSQEILVNSKQVSLQMGDKELVAGSNVINREVAEGEKYDFDVTVNRGAWTETVAPEKAMEMELEYQIGIKQFSLTLDANGGLPTRVLKVYNGADTNLPEPKREGYQFEGWQDEDGNIYTDEYVMPIGDATLTAVWRKLNAYAIYSASDGYLTFVQSADLIQKGQVYNGKTVTSVYTGFEEANYTSASQVPWHADGTYKNIKRVIIQDKIKPVSTAYWFYECEQCMRFEMKNLDTSKVTSMEWMYYLTGRNKETAYVITGMDTWDTSQVTNMLGLFEGSGIYVSMFDIGDVGKWNVSKVTDMRRMFSAAGMRATNVYIGDLSNWDTRSLTQTVYMFEHFAWQTPSINIGNIGKQVLPENEQPKIIKVKFHKKVTSKRLQVKSYKYKIIRKRSLSCGPRKLP